MENKYNLNNSINLGGTYGGDLYLLENIKEKWSDFSFPVTNLRINPTTNKPDFDFTNGEYLFDPLSTESIIGGNITSHSFKLPTPEWRPHIHWNQTQPGVVKWQLEYKIIPANTIESDIWTTLTTTTQVFTYTSGNLHQISSFPSINMSNETSTAVMMKVRISRLGGDIEDTYIVDARFYQFDIHVKINDFGSTSEFLND